MKSTHGGDSECKGRHLACPKCGDVVPIYYMVKRICYSCHLDRYVPRGYEQAEQYRWDPVWGHMNATKRPPLGVPFLDQTALRLELLLLALRGRPRGKGAAGQRR